MKRILIEHFQSLDNYGTGMMGLVTVQALADRYGTAEVEFHCDFADAATLEAVRRELRGDVRLYRHEPADYYTASITNIWGKAFAPPVPSFLFAGGAGLRPADRIGRGRYFGILLENRPLRQPVQKVGVFVPDPRDPARTDARSFLDAL